jgi:GGDEF domain-containing protein
VLPGSEPDPQIVAKAARLIASKLRTYDLVACISDARVAALLLDADNHHASTVAYRIKADIQVEIPGAGKWKAGVATFGRDGADGDSLIQVALRRMDDGSGANAA